VKFQFECKRCGKQPEAHVEASTSFGTFGGVANARTFRHRNEFSCLVPPLAPGVAAYRPPRLMFRWLEGSFTVAASPFDHTGGCRTGSVAISRREI